MKEYLESNIESIEFFDEEMEMCEIEVEYVHCYYANGILTHNCAQELVCQANLANARNWVNTFNSGGDLHETMAKSIWGEEKYNKEYRKKAKALNFGLLYGMSAYTMKERINEPLEETKKIIEKYWKGCPEIPAYQKAVLRKAKKEGTIYTYFGLPRRVKYYLESSDPKRRAFGERTCANTMIQGSCSTITLLALLKVYKNLYTNPDWSNDCTFFSYIHDEIVSSVKKERVREFIPILKESMEMNFKGLPVPFRTSVSIGTTWGCQIEFKMDADGKLIPDMDRI